MLAFRLHNRSPLRVFVVLATVFSVGLLSLPAPFAQAIVPADAITYVYDDLGRLEAVVYPGQTNGIARYNYDGAGNLTSISRQSSSVTTVIDFQPKKTTRGSEVRVYGAGFSATAGQTTVRFGGPTGTIATVTSATKSQLVVTVPLSGAVDGTVYVSSPSGNSTSVQQFALDTSVAPTITGFTPSIALPGSTLTITGTGFDASSPAMNNVFLNGIRAQVTAATSTSLTVVVPPFLTSGQISVQTRWGQAGSTDDLFVPPIDVVLGVPYAVSDVESTGRTTIGTQTTVNVATAGKLAVRLFDANEGDRVFLDFSSPSGNQAFLNLVDPFGRVIGSGLMSTGYVDNLTLPATGAYQVVVDPYQSQTGTFTFTVLSVPNDLSGTVVPDGSAVVANIVAKGQNASYTFTGTANQRVSLLWTGSGWTGNGYIRLLRPEGSELTNGLFTNGWIDPVVLPSRAPTRSSSTLQGLPSAPPRSTSTTCPPIPRDQSSRTGLPST